MWYASVYALLALAALKYCIHGSPKSHGVNSEPLCKGFRTSDPQRKVMVQSSYWDVITCFYAFSDIPKSL